MQLVEREVAADQRPRRGARLRRIGGDDRREFKPASALAERASRRQVSPRVSLLRAWVLVSRRLGGRFVRGAIFGAAFTGFAGGFFLVFPLAPAMVPVRSLDGETRPASARCCGIWIVYLERLADEIVDEVDLGAADVGQRDRVDETTAPSRSMTMSSVARVRIEIETVLETGAAAAGDADAERRAARFGRKDARDPFRRAFGQS